MNSNKMRSAGEQTAQHLAVLHVGSHRSASASVMYYVDLKDVARAEESHGWTDPFVHMTLVMEQINVSWIIRNELYSLASRASFFIVIAIRGALLLLSVARCALL